MPRIRQINVRNFRALKEFGWCPSPGFNCIIGPGDSGKSTILDSIDIALGARRSYTFTDADFFQSNTSLPIEIWVTLGDLPDELKSIESYGYFLRGFNEANLTIRDEPEVGDEVVITIKVTVNQDLDPDWSLYSDRAAAEGIERRLVWKHRELLSSARLGESANYHLAWGSRSILNKFSEQSLDVNSTLAQISRDARTAFAANQPGNIGSVLTSVKSIADSLGVNLGALQAQLDVKGISLSSGAVALHDEDNTPLRQLGSGSTRLLISGLHKAASSAGILLVDEAEHGLEPYRISRLLNELGSKSENLPTKQVFITTHSPYVLRELKADQLNVLRTDLTPEIWSQKIYHLNSGNNQQAALRACAEAFFCKKVIICEGKTEIGLIRGFDLYGQDNAGKSIYANGVYCADGGGDNLFSRAHVFVSLGYPVAIFKDSDKTAEHSTATQLAINAGIRVYEWGQNCAVEDAIFNFCPASTINSLINIAIERKGYDSVNGTVLAKSGNQYGIDRCLNQFEEGMRDVLARAAKDKSWYKDVEPAERISREIIAPNFHLFSEPFRTIINGLFQFSNEGV